MPVRRRSGARRGDERRCRRRRDVRPRVPVAPDRPWRRLPPPPSPLRSDRAVRRADRSGQGVRGADRVLQPLRQGRRRRDAGAHGREADGAARGAVHQLCRPAVGSRAVAGARSRDGRRSALHRTKACRFSRSKRLSVGTPILVNGRSPVLVEHCVRSNGGLYYADGDEFVECLKLLVSRRSPSRRHGPQRPRVRPPQLPLGCRAG